MNHARVMTAKVGDIRASRTMGSHSLGSLSRTTVLIASTLLLGASSPSVHSRPSAARVTPLRSPAGPGSQVPNLAIMPDGRVVMSWIEPLRDRGLALLCASFDGQKWSQPATIAAGDSFFVNWADFPSIRPLGGQRLAAHWLWRSGSGTYAYDVRVSQSENGGRTWTQPITPHRDGTATEHGFASLASAGDAVLALWLDGRKTVGHDEASSGPMPDMTLRAASVESDGQLRDEVEIDGRTCDCCQTAAVTTDRGILVAYRDRSPDEVRDICVARWQKGQWSRPELVHADNWHIAGCPVNGPAMDARRSHVAITWYTAAADTPRVYVAFSEDAGETFGPPTRIDEGNPLGRVHVALLADGSALATWIEASGRDAVIRTRRIPVHGPMGVPVTVTRTSAARASGCPRVVSLGDAVLFAWTEAGTTPRVRVATMSIK